MNWTDQMIFTAKEELYHHLSSDLVDYEFEPFLKYTPLDFYNISIDYTPCLYKSITDDVYEKIPTSLTTIEELNTLAKDLDLQFLMREGYIIGRHLSQIDYSLTDYGNIANRFKFEVGHLIRLTPKYKSVSRDHFDPTPPNIPSLTQNYPKDMSFNEYYETTFYPTYRKVYEELRDYNDQVLECIIGNQPSIFSLSVKCLSHLTYRPCINGMLYMMINDPEHLELIQKEGIELLFENP